MKSAVPKTAPFSATISTAPRCAAANIARRWASSNVSRLPSGSPVATSLTLSTRRTVPSPHRFASEALDPPTPFRRAPWTFTHGTAQESEHAPTPAARPGCDAIHRPDMDLWARRRTHLLLRGIGHADHD